MAFEPVRLAWKIKGDEGHGSSFISTVTNIEMLQAWVREMNQKYGFGTHWLETQPQGTILNPNVDGKFLKLNTV